MTAVRRALISVSDKTGVEGFARELVALGLELLSTGGTATALRDAGIAVREVSEHTGFPEMMDGRVKTLHPRVHGGILALRDDAGHVAAMKEHGIAPIDLVVVNLYPFERTVAKPGVERAEAIEQIDIGGPSMVRSAAKNHAFVGVVTDPADYGRVLDALQKGGGSLPERLRRELARKAFAHTAAYDAAIARWLFEKDGPGPEEGAFPAVFTLAGAKALELRYGENPHQRAAFYRERSAEPSAGRERSGEPSVASAEVLSGKALSYNNLVDLDAALALAKEFERPFAAVTKHNNPCGAAEAETLVEALAAAWEGDPLSAFGSVLALNRPLGLAEAEFLASDGRFVEAIVAPSFEPEAFALLTTKPRWGRNVRLLACGPFGPGARDARELELRKLVGGFLVAERDLAAADLEGLQIATKRAPSEAERTALLFAERVAKHVKSNAIVLARGTTVVGVGAGQMSRVDAVRLACEKAGLRARGAVLASDAFFPFPDGPEAAMEAGVSALLQPGGSVRDAEVVAACDRRGAAMVLTGTRHFRH